MGNSVPLLRRPGWRYDRYRTKEDDEQDRESRSIGQEGWTRKSLEFLGTLFGGATAFPKAQGVWRDDERDGQRVWDEPVIVHCYASERDLKERAAQLAVGEFFREMGRSTNQGEVGLVIDNVYHAVRTE